MKNLVVKTATSFFLFALLLSVNGIYSQERPYRDMERNRERIEAHKVAFITERLDLSSEEAEKFWPVYNVFKKDMKEMQENWRKQHDLSPEDIATITDEQAEQFAQDQMRHEQEMLDLRKELVTNMKGIISPQKILMLLESEKQFKVELMKKVSQGRNSDFDRGRD